MENENLIRDSIIKIEELERDKEAIIDDVDSIYELEDINDEIEELKSNVLLYLRGISEDNNEDNNNEGNDEEGSYEEINLINFTDEELIIIKEIISESKNGDF